jgi:hypothetical protein
MIPFDQSYLEEETVETFYKQKLQKQHCVVVNQAYRTLAEKTSRILDCPTVD